LVVGAAVIDAIEEMHPVFPTIDRAQRKELAAVRTALGAQRR
jgi:hypothetical protein